MVETFPPRMPVVVSAAVRRGDELAFVRYAYGPFKGIWTFPTGYVDAGEQPDAAAVRETLEEAGIKSEIEGLLCILTMVWDGEPMLYLVFLARHVGGEPCPDGREVDQAAFLGRAALDAGDMAFDGQNAWLARRILDGESQVLLPYDSRPWHEGYLTTFA